MLKSGLSDDLTGHPSYPSSPPADNDPVKAGNPKINICNCKATDLVLLSLFIGHHCNFKYQTPPSR